jgi:hypothetical protein
MSDPKRPLCDPCQCIGIEREAQASYTFRFREWGTKPMRVCPEHFRVVSAWAGTLGPVSS